MRLIGDDMRVVMIRTNGVNPDPRVEKEVNSIIKDGNNSVIVLAWDRESNHSSDSILQLSNGIARIIRFGVPSEWGGGFKKNLLPLLKFSVKVHKWLKSHVNEYDCLHCCDLPTAMMASPYIKRKKFVYDIYDYFADTAHAPKVVLDYARNKENAMIEMADVTIICSEQRVRQLGNAKPRRLEVIHNSPDSSLLDKVISEEKHIIKSDSKKKKIVYVGNLIRERYIDIVADVISQMSDVEFHVGGVGPLSETLENISKEKTNIFFYGKMVYSDVIALEHDCDYMLALYDPEVPNNRFAAPNKFYEALLLGKPIIMCRNTGMDAVVSEKNYGVVIEPTRQSIEDGINRLISQGNDWANKVGKDMKKTYEELYSWKTMDNRLSNIYKEL